MHSPSPDKLDASHPERLHPTEMDHYVAHLQLLRVPWFIAFCAGSWLIHDAVSLWVLAAWMTSYLVVFSFRVASLARYARLDFSAKQEKQAYWLNLFECSSVLHSSLWGVLIWLSLPELPVLRQFLVTWIVVVAGALAAISIPAGAVNRRRYLLTTLGPACVAWYTRGAPEGAWVALALIVLFFVYGELWKRYGGVVRERLAHVGELALANELLKQSHASKTRIFAEASHDLRQPVHVLGMMLDGIDTQGPRSEIARRLQEVQTCADNISDMLIDLLDLARLEASDYMVELGPM